MSETAYDSEDVLQALIARFPDLLAGDQLPGDVPRRWLLIGREAALPADEDGAGRWSVDHLFLDQDAVPTLVEVKRSSDTRIRREVIGQMLDYAANAVVYWPIDALRTVFERRCETEGRDAETELGRVLGEEDEETYWAQAAANLKAGRIRLVFVADQIPRELRRVVEFLNEQMSAEVLAIEVKQYLGEGGVRTLVPRVIGQTAATTPSRTGGGRWDEPSFFTELERRRGPAEAAVARKLLAWARANMTRVTWGKGRVDGSLIPVLEQDGQQHLPFAIYTYGAVEIQFQWLIRPPFDSPDVRGEFLARLNQIPGVQLPEDAITRRPRIQLSALAADPTAMDGLIHALEWFRDTAAAGSSDYRRVGRDRPRRRVCLFRV